MTSARPLEASTKWRCARAMNAPMVISCHRKYSLPASTFSFAVDAFSALERKVYSPGARSAIRNDLPCVWPYGLPFMCMGIGTAWPMNALR